MIEQSRSRWQIHISWHIDNHYRMGYGAMQLAGPGVSDRRVTLMKRSLCCARRWLPA